MNLERFFWSKKMPLTGGMIFLLLFLQGCGGDSSLRKTPEPVEKETLIERESSWRGGVIGAVLGNPFKGKISDVSRRALLEGAKENKPMVFLSIDGIQRIEVYPLEADSENKPSCRRIKVRSYQNGKLIREEIKESCP